MKNDYVFGKVIIRFPFDWCVQKPDDPFTLTKCEDGVGSLQFSQAEFRGGKSPLIKLDDLITMVNSLGESNSMKKIQNEIIQTEKVFGASGDFRWEKDFVKVWYLTNSKDIILITYTCKWIYKDEEKVDFSQIISELKFTQTVN